MNENSQLEISPLSSVSIIQNSKGSTKFAFAFGMLILLGVIILLLFALELPSVKKRIPKIDPYELVRLSSERQMLYSQYGNFIGDSTPYLDLAESAFLQGEVFEAEYFLGKAKSFEAGYNPLKTKIDDYKKLKEQLTNSLYDDRIFWKDPYVYEEQYKTIDHILDLSETGYVRVRHLFLKGYLLLKEGRRTEARLIFDDLRKNGGVLAETSLYLYSKTFIQDSEVKEGIVSFREYIDKYPDSRLSPLASVYLATLLIKDEKSKDALTVINDRLVNSSSITKPEYYPELLLIKESLERNPSEITKIRLELFRDFHSVDAVFKRALQMYDQWDEGKTKIEDTRAYLEIANVLVENARFIQAKKLLDALKKDISKEEENYLNLIYAKRQKGADELDSAISYCKLITSNSPDNDLKSQAYRIMGEIYGLKKDVANAEKHYVLAGKMKGRMGDYSLREVGRIAYKNGWRAKAEEYYADLADMYPDSQYVSEALNYLVVLKYYKGDYTIAERYANMLREKGTDNEDRIKGDYYLGKMGKGDSKYKSSNPLAYYSFIAGDSPVSLYIDPDKAYPDVSRFKSNLAWEYFLCGCWDLAEKEYEYIADRDDPYRKMVLSYLAYYHREPSDGIRATRDFTAGNYQAGIEMGYSKWFFKKAFPLDYLSAIESVSAERNFPTSIILGIIRQESFFDPKARSHAGAQGLMQIMPATGKWIAQSIGESKGYSNSKLTDPPTNLKYGGWYLSHLRDMLGNEQGMILAGHNGGPGNVGKWKEMFPVWESDKYLFYDLIPAMETRNFVRYVLTNKKIYEELLKEQGKEVYF